MSVENDFLVMATETTALVDTQSNYAGSGYQQKGFQPGITLPQQFNKAFRQGTTGMAVIAGLIVEQLNESVLDNTVNGNVATLVGQLKAAIVSLASSSVTPSVISTSYSATPVFDASLGNPLVAVFEILLTGNVSSSTLINTQPGMLIVMNVLQDGTGSRAFSAPSNLPMGTIDTTANQVNTQSFVVLNSGVIVPTGPLMLKV